MGVAALVVVACAVSARAQAPAPAVRPLDPHAVRLTAGPFKTAQDVHHRYLLALEADRLLARFRNEAGLTAKALPYDGWEADTISGHSLGHYLSGLAKMFAATGDPRLKERAAYVVQELAACQGRFGDGYVAAIPGGRKVFDELRRNEVRSAGFDLNGLWVPWYVLHKEMAGLRDALILCGLESARPVLIGLADFSAGVALAMDDAAAMRMLRCEHGGMNEVAADVFALTGDPRHRALARRFDDWVVLGPLAEGRSVLPGLHSNTQVPKVIGAARQWELDGADPRHREAAIRYWRTIVERHTYANGGNSENEYLGPDGRLAGRLDGNTTETCNTYNQLKLTLRLFGWSPEVAYMDYYERAMWNHILGSQDPETAGVLYFTPFRTGSRKPFQRPFDDFTCCVGSGFENHASYGDAIYATTTSPAGVPPTIYVSQFVSSTADWRAEGVTLELQSGLPESGRISARVGVAAPKRFRLMLRVPAWVGLGAAARIGAEPVPIPASLPAGGYLACERVWKDGDVVVLELPMTLRAEATPDDPDRLALFHGPILLGGDLSRLPPSSVASPAIVSDERDPAAWFHLTAAAPATYRSAGAVRPDDVVLKPFFRFRREPYAVYWRRVAPADYAAEEAEQRREGERRRAIEARTIDFVQPGEMQPERDHAFEGERSGHGEHLGLRWRDAHRGGRFSFLMKSPGDRPADLVCTYWGGDAGDRTFDVMIDDVVIAVQTLDRNAPGRFFEVAYPIPAEAARGKDRLRATFRAHAAKTAGGVFGVRILTRS